MPGYQDAALLLKSQTFRPSNTTSEEMEVLQRGNKKDQKLMSTLATPETQNSHSANATKQRSFSVECVAGDA